MRPRRRLSARKNPSSRMRRMNQLPQIRRKICPATLQCRRRHQPPPAQTNPPAAKQAPAQPVQTRAPTAQNPGPVVSIQPTAPTAPPVQQTQRPAQQTQAPAQTGNQGGEGGNQSTYSRDNGVAGTFLGTVNSDKYHSGNCSAARRIPPENEVWYNSEAEARAAGRDRCGICWR